MSPARARTRTARSGDERTNHEATAPPQLYICQKKTFEQFSIEFCVVNQNQSNHSGHNLGLFPCLGVGREKTLGTRLLWPIANYKDDPVNQSKLGADTWNWRKARENVRVTIGFGLTSVWMIKWCDFYEPIAWRTIAKPMQRKCEFAFLHSSETLNLHSNSFTRV